MEIFYVSLYIHCKFIVTISEENKTQVINRSSKKNSNELTKYTRKILHWMASDAVYYVKQHV